MNKKKWHQLHSWTGLITGLFIFIMGISGSLLVFHDEISAWQFHAHTSLENPDQTLSVDAAVSSVQQQFPHWDIRLKKLHNKPEKAFLFDIRNGDRRKTAYVHPGTGKIVKLINADEDWSNWLLKFHYSLRAGLAGRIMVLLIGCLFFTSLITGFILYRKSILKVLLFRVRFKSGSSRQVLSSLHRFVGVWALILNLLLVITGITLSITVVQSGLKKAVTPATPEIRVSLDHMLAQSQNQYPEFTPLYLRLPLNAESPIIVYGRVAGDSPFWSRFYNRLTASTVTGEITGLRKISDQGLGEKLASMVQPLHYAEFGGFWIKLLYCLCGLTPPLLSVTGFLLWRKRIRGISQKQDVFHVDAEPSLEGL